MTPPIIVSPAFSDKFAKVVGTDIQTRQRPDGEMDTRGGKGDGLDILVLTCTQESLQQGPGCHLPQVRMLKCPRTGAKRVELHTATVDCGTAGL